MYILFSFQNVVAISVIIVPILQRSSRLQWTLGVVFKCVLSAVSGV